MHARKFTQIGPKRAKIVFYLFLAIGLFLTYKLFHVQVIEGPVLARAALAQRSDTIDVFARRGSILDRSGSVMVRSMPSESVYAVPHDLLDADRAVTQLRAVFGKLDPAVIVTMHDKHMQFVWIARKVSHDAAERVRERNISGIKIIEEDTGRRYDTVGRMASTVLGFVGIDENGLDGLEYSFDNLLKGSSGKVSLEEDEFGRPLPFGHEDIIKAARPGLNLELTLDSYLQFVTERALDSQVKLYHAQSGTAIVMDPQTGEVLALANSPNFDPNTFSKFPIGARRDRAVEDAYEPGSTYKLVTAAAALDSGKVTTRTGFPVSDTLEVGGRTIHNADDGFIGNANGTETLKEIIQDSLNVGAARVGIAIGAKTFYAMERKAGFGIPTQIGLPGENPGIVPAPAQWSDSSLATMSFGQGVAVTPIALTRFYCAIANGGVLLRPRILDAIADAQGKVLYRYKPEVEHRIFSKTTAATLRGFLRAVVLHGTGNPSAQIPGYTTAGKTGTAQMALNGTYESGAYVASFIGMIPAEHPRYVIYVKVERPQGAIYGSVVAAPAFVQIAKAAMLHSGNLPAVERLVRPTAKPK
ncbi:MAG: penicillin-binding protein 2 [Candidatus Eremiobacteraeota bacterium]|nr:penicillin-binding protein 2 [Candidatus Eremiobacteraeota bacterium]